jgi:hypothetical protein
VDAAAQFNGATRAGFSLRPSQIQERVVEIAIPPGIANEEQQSALQGVVKYGQQHGVTVKITEIK